MSFFYSIQQGFKNIMRNKLFSLVSIATMSACIFLFGIFFMIVTNFQKMVRTAEEGVAITVFFQDNTSEETIFDIGQKIGMRPEVRDCIYVSAEEAWEDFKVDYFRGAEELAEGFENDNPLANSAHYEIYINDVSMQNALVTYIEAFPEVSSVHRSEVAANTLTDFNNLLKYISVSIIVILFLVAIFLISNTVNVGIAVRKEEIAVMKLIGATDYFVRAPFVVEGILIGLIGSAIPLVILYFLYEKIIEYIADRFNFINSIIDFLPASNVFRFLIPAALILGVGVGFIGSAITVRKHLRV